MPIVRLRRDPDEDEPGLGSVEFEILPRAGEIIRLGFGEHRGFYRVESVEHRFPDHTKPATLHLLLIKL